MTKRVTSSSSVVNRKCDKRPEVWIIDHETRRVHPQVNCEAATHPAYNPLSYHPGSVWAVENGTILFGLRRFGFDAEALRLARAL